MSAQQTLAEASGRILPFRRRAPPGVTWGGLEEPIDALGRALQAASRSGRQLVGVYRLLARAPDEDAADMLRASIDLAILNIRHVRRLEGLLLELARRANYEPPVDPDGPA